ncbi:hypothetical protein GCM10020218_093090 [Dactylosporangium vinaceum]
MRDAQHGDLERWPCLSARRGLVPRSSPRDVIARMTKEAESLLRRRAARRGNPRTRRLSRMLRRTTAATSSPQADFATHVRRPCGVRRCGPGPSGRARLPAAAGEAAARVGTPAPRVLARTVNLCAL